MAYNIFISYRRSGGFETAKHLYDLLTRDGYKVSFDIDTLRNGDFDVELLKRIDECTDFIVVLNQGAFDKCFNLSIDKKNDWLRNELAYALKKGKNIIPIMLDGFAEFPNNLPEDICQVSCKNGPEYNQYYFDEFYNRLKERFLHPSPPTLYVSSVGLIKKDDIQDDLENAHSSHRKKTTFLAISILLIIVVIATAVILFLIDCSIPPDDISPPEKQEPDSVMDTTTETKLPENTAEFGLKEDTADLKSSKKPVPKDTLLTTSEQTKQALLKRAEESVNRGEYLAALADYLQYPSDGYRIFYNKALKLKNERNQNCDDEIIELLACARELAERSKNRKDIEQVNQELKNCE